MKMSFRHYTRFLLRHGKFLVQQYCKRNIHANILEPKGNRQLTAENLKQAAKLAKDAASKNNNNLLKFGSHARRLFVDNILNRVTNPVSSELRSQATRTFGFGNPAPFFALVGVSLASGSGVLTKDDELEGVCWEIREAVYRRFENNIEANLFQNSIGDNLKLDHLDIGPPIAKGCSAVVYSASLKNNIPKSSTLEKVENIELPNLSETISDHHNVLSPFQNMNRFTQNFGGSVDNLLHISNSPRGSLSGTNSKHESNTSTDKGLKIKNVEKSVKFDDNAKVIVRSRHTSLTSNNSDTIESEQIPFQIQSSDFYRYPLALKMMFNYDIQSNAMAILKAMHKEAIPARRRHNIDTENWERILQEQSMTLPPHPNIVLMFGVFCDQIPNLQNSVNMYPMALPPRINPNGYGRNMSMFMLMKRYNSNLQSLLEETQMNMRTRVLLFAQLLESVAHLNRYGIAHRDIKSDNILIDTQSDELPILVLSDFGCCIADKKHGLRIPYTTNEIDKGGNTALMAPEILMKTPGTFSVLNYTKSDLWACGTIAYEIFGHINPFYNNVDQLTNEPLRSENYEETDLPELDNEVPYIIRKLIENILQRNPNHRLTPEVAANVLQLYLWAPSSWISGKSKPTNNEILQWLLSLTTKVLCEGSGLKTKYEYMNKSRRTYTEFLVITSFLQRAKIRKIRQSLNWIQTLE